MAASEFSVRRVWMQPILIHASTSGLISESDYLSLVAKLLASDYDSTMFNPFVLSKAGTMAEWDAEKWPLNKALKQLGNLNIPDDQVIAFAAVLTMNLFKETSFLETRQTAFIRMLEQLSA